jgi:hypothetical protein
MKSASGHREEMIEKRSDNELAPDEQSRQAICHPC